MESQLLWEVTEAAGVDPESIAAFDAANGLGLGRGQAAHMIENVTAILGVRQAARRTS
ncbi:hypothetical protein ACFS2C_17675 [Prauserella oleivorans]|uniref:Uncharacterized protein n=1 Tax=Prauserella oleivorans TaxID=1478153 RepID=A0ABW5WCI3_9PSEU